MPGVYQDLVSLSELRELVMDREAWRAVIHGVSKSWIQLSDWTELNLYYILKYFINSSMKDTLKFSFKWLYVSPSFS